MKESPNKGSHLRHGFVGSRLADLFPRLGDGLSSFAGSFPQLLPDLLPLLQDLCLLQLLHCLNKE